MTRAGFLVCFLILSRMLVLDAWAQESNFVVADDRDSLSVSPAVLSIRGCMNSACHGSQQVDAPEWQRAGRTWFDTDPHAHAYTTLLRDASQRIVNRMVGPAPIGTSEYQRVLETRCVSCHSDELAPLAERALGADCQVCHGPADAWGEEHYAQATLAKGARRFANTQRMDMESIAVRAKVCASCHVGELNRNGSDREVDHQLMAAGHPTTYFDFGNYLERYPVHWDRAGEAARLGVADAYQKWRIGKLQTAIARIQLLCDRASRNAEWPEFTEYSCTSCHHELSASAWRQGNRNRARSVWDEWYLEFVDLAIVRQAPDPSSTAHDGIRLRDSLNHLRQLMEKPFPDTSKVVEASQDILRQLSQAALASTDLSIDNANLRLDLREILASDAFTSSWEKGAQWAIASRAFATSLGLSSPEIAFGNQSQDGFFGAPRVWTLGQPSSFESSAWFQPGSLKDYRDSLHEQLENKP